MTFGYFASNSFFSAPHHFMAESVVSNVVSCGVGHRDRGLGRRPRRRDAGRDPPPSCSPLGTPSRPPPATACTLFRCFMVPPVPFSVDSLLLRGLDGAPTLSRWRSRAEQAEAGLDVEEVDAVAVEGEVDSRPRARASGVRGSRAITWASPTSSVAKTSVPVCSLMSTRAAMRGLSPGRPSAEVQVVGPDPDQHRPARHAVGQAPGDVGRSRRRAPRGHSTTTAPARGAQRPLDTFILGEPMNSPTKTEPGYS